MCLTSSHPSVWTAASCGRRGDGQPFSCSFFFFPADASGLLSPAGSGSLQEVVCVLSRGSSADYRLPGALPWLLGAPGVQTPAVGCHHHPGVHPRNDRASTVQEAEGRGNAVRHQIDRVTGICDHVIQLCFSKKLCIFTLCRSVCTKNTKRCLSG